MMEAADLLLFAFLVRKPDSELDLEQAALLVAELEYGGLDLDACRRKLDALAADARARMGYDPRRPSITPLLEFLYREVGFCGNTSDYYDPQNSFLNDVLDRRTGIPITLALVVVCVAARLGIEAEGVCFPGHFLVRARGRSGEPIFVDPFEGRILPPGRLRLLYEQATGDPGPVDPACLEPAGRKQILARMLNNLRAIYEVRGDKPRLRRVLQRLAILNPSSDIENRLALLVDNAPLTPRLSVN